MEESLGVGITNGIDPELAQQAATKVAIALQRGNVEQAHAIINQVVSSKATLHNRDDILKLPLASSGLETRIVNQLEVYGIHTVGELLNTPRTTLLSFPNFGNTSLDKVLAAMAQLGFTTKEIGMAEQKSFFDTFDRQRLVQPCDVHVEPEDVQRLTGQNAAILARLRQGPATNDELIKISRKYTSRISDLRKAGYVITCLRGESGLNSYTLGQ